MKTTATRIISTLKLCGILLAGAVSQAANADALENCAGYKMHSCPEPMDEPLPDPRKMLTWGQKERVVGFKNTYRQYAGDVFQMAPGAVARLEPAGKTLPDIRYNLYGKERGLQDYLHSQSVAGLLVLKDGKIVLEHYADGVNESTLWTSRSVAKSIVAVLIGAAVKDGLIDSVDTPVTQFIPELKGTAWEGVSLQQIMQHTSGVAWNEDYAEPNSDFSRMTLCEATADPYGCLLKLVAGVGRQAKPGERWSYNTGGAWLVGLVLERATGMTIAKYLETKLWKPYGMERDGVWHALVPGKVDMGGHGFNASLRDWGRVGQFVADNGVLPNGEQVLPVDWIKRSTDWTRAEGSVQPWAPNGQYGYQWWYMGFEPDDGSSPIRAPHSEDTFWGYGIFGQAMAINQKENLVMIQWSTWKEAEGPDELYSEQALLFNALIQALHK